MSQSAWGRRQQCGRLVHIAATLPPDGQNRPVVYRGQSPPCDGLLVEGAATIIGGDAEGAQESSSPSTVFFQRSVDSLKTIVGFESSGMWTLAEGSGHFYIYIYNQAFMKHFQTIQFANSQIDGG